MTRAYDEIDAYNSPATYDGDIITSKFRALALATCQAIAEGTTADGGKLAAFGPAGQMQSVVGGPSTGTLSAKGNDSKSPGGTTTVVSGAATATLKGV